MMPSTATPASTPSAAAYEAPLASTDAVTALPSTAPSCLTALNAPEAAPAAASGTDVIAVIENGDQTNEFAAPNSVNAAARGRLEAPRAISAAQPPTETASRTAPAIATRRGPSVLFRRADSGAEARQATPMGISVNAAAPPVR